jgi:hypothetical protein
LSPEEADRLFALRELIHALFGPIPGLLGEVGEAGAGGQGVEVLGARDSLAGG